MSLLFDPVQVGTMALRNRIFVPTHAAGAGRILGSENEAERFIAYYVRRARGGAAWIGGSSTFLRSPLIPGYEPSGVGAVVRGSYRHPLFVERHKRYMDALHEAGAYGTIQMIIQGGLPHGASPAVTGFVSQDVPHALTRPEIAEVVEEYGWSAARALEAEVDGLELHANHDDLLQFFLSPLSNQRDDEYGEDRMRLLLEALQSIRAAVARRLTVGVRLCMDELIEGGYDFADGLEMARRLSTSGLVDYLHVDVGNNWGAPSYLQPMQYQASEWTAMAGTVRAAVDVPVVYTGRVTDATIAERILVAGEADVVGIARAMIADPDLPNKARNGGALRPCVGSNECLHRGLVDGMRFSCAVNPAAGHELIELEPAVSPRRVLIVGGGPAGLETAAIAAERGHDVTLWEREDELGGQLAIAANAPSHESFAAYLAHQAGRLSGAHVETGREATAEDVVAFGADAVVIATGASARLPDVPGVEHALEIRDVMTGSETGKRVALIVGDDTAAPLLAADYLASRGKSVRVIYPGPQLAPGVGKYSIGGYVARLFAAGVEFIPMQRLVRVAASEVHTADVYAGMPRVFTDVDSVVLAFGGIPRSDLYDELTDRVDELHILGDAWAPRRLTIATRQAWELGEKTVIHHAGLRVSDAERASEFYCALGGTRLVRPILLTGRGAEQVVGVDGAQLRIALIGFGDSALELFEILDPAPDWARAPVVGTIPHVCLQVDDVEAALTRAEELGGERLWPAVDRWGASHAIYLTDPDGNALELIDASVSAVAASFHKYFPGAKP